MMAKTKKKAGGLSKEVVKLVEALLEGGHAHATFDDAVKDFPAKLRGVVPEGLPYSCWQIVEHIRIAQQDMLEFSNNADGSYKEKEWPKDYWPVETVPASDAAWKKSIAEVHAGRKAFVKLLQKAGKGGLVAPFAWGKGQSLLQEALQVADHNAYHVGELIVVRRVLGCWKK